MKLPYCTAKGSKPGRLPLGSLAFLVNDVDNELVTKHLHQEGTKINWLTCMTYFSFLILYKGAMECPLLQVVPGR